MMPQALSKKTIAVIGCGQIGGSILKRLSQLKPRITLLAHDRDRRLSTKVARHAEWVTEFASVIDRADIVIIATPVPAIVETLGRIAKAIKPRKTKLLVLDTGTVRQAVHAEAAKHKSRFDHAGLHPLAGAEGEGWESSRADLFVGKRIAITPALKSRLPIVRDLVKVLGAVPVSMNPKTHDRFVAEAIGLPHLLAFAAQGMSSGNPLRAGSWASLTRVAASNPAMVAGFLSANAREQKKVIAQFERELSRLKKSLNDRSGRALLKLLTDYQRLES
jgi:prephenate dehydrogenase